MNVEIGQVFADESKTYTVLSISGKHARVRMSKPGFRHVPKSEGGPATVPVWEKDIHVNILLDMND